MRISQTMIAQQVEKFATIYKFDHYSVMLIFRSLANIEREISQMVQLGLPFVETDAEVQKILHYLHKLYEHGYFDKE